MAVEAYLSQGITGQALREAVVRQMQAVRGSYQAAAAAAAAVGIVDE
jgi:hypothetical protein